MIRNDQLNVELFKDAEEKFKRHLKIQDNERIIFSGRFGHGKTTFLREFFKEENLLFNFNFKKYNVISIYPVNYSIASNEDVFRYIKYDIILEMLKQGYELDEEIVSFYKILPKFLKDNYVNIFAAIIHMIPNLGKDVIDNFERCEKLIKNYYDIIEEKPSDQFIKYLEELEQQDGSIYEDNLVSKLIEQVLHSQRTKENAEETILLIDDLDRIDPEHIFRILNIFAAHFDKTNRTKNKFGFDKIILVCDIDNIRNIFKAKYGIYTDFNGYIDKFYSYEVFDYSIRQGIANYTFSLMQKATWHMNGYSSNPNDIRWTKDKVANKENFFRDMLHLLFDNRQVDLRNIVKWKMFPVNFIGNIVFKNNAIIDEAQYPVLFYLRLLCAIKGSPEGLKASFQNLSENVLHADTIARHIEDLCYILTVFKHENHPGGSYLIKLKDRDVSFNVNHNSEYSASFTGSDATRFDISHLAWVLCETIDFLVGQDRL